jgi:hypothetical protein
MLTRKAHHGRLQSHRLVPGEAQGRASVLASPDPELSFQIEIRAECRKAYPIGTRYPRSDFKRNARFDPLFIEQGGPEDVETLHMHQVAFHRWVGRVAGRSAQYAHGFRAKSERLGSHSE